MAGLGTIFVPAAGPLSAALAFLAQSPGTVEEEKGEPLVGPAGALLQAVCLEVGIVWAEVYRTNVFNFRLLEHDSDVVQFAVDQVRGKVATELRALKKIRAIVTFGNEAMYCVTKQWGITKRRGHSWIWAVPGTPIIFATFHPSYVLRTHGAGTVNGKTPREWLVHDLKTVVRRLAA